MIYVDGDGKKWRMIYVDGDGPAFPVNGPNGDHPGMSYRQWLVGQVLPIVAQAMQGKYATSIPDVVLAIVDSVIKKERKTRIED